MAQMFMDFEFQVEIYKFERQFIPNRKPCSEENYVEIYVLQNVDSSAITYQKMFRSIYAFAKKIFRII